MRYMHGTFQLPHYLPRSFSVFMRSIFINFYFSNIFISRLLFSFWTMYRKIPILYLFLSFSRNHSISLSFSQSLSSSVSLFVQICRFVSLSPSLFSTLPLLSLHRIGILFVISLEEASYSQIK